MSPDEERHSQALEADLIRDPDEKAHAEARNALKQFDTVVQAIEYWIHPERPFQLRPSLILTLNRDALEGISAYAGNYRPAGIEIKGSEHRPVGAHLVPERVEELCDYVNANWTSSPLHLAAYILWRLNWIHPFVDGNGRTARALAYLALCVRLGYRLPGTRTIPDQIAENKTPYYRALEAADKAAQAGKVDVGEMEELLSRLLANQLVSVHQEAKTGRAARPGERA